MAEERFAGNIARWRGRGRSIVSMWTMRPGRAESTSDPVGQKDGFVDIVGDKEDGTRFVVPGGRAARFAVPAG